jgi:hypothetical protein
LLTFAELQAFIDHLPPESATQTVLRDQYTDKQLADMSVGLTAHGAWSKQHMLLAAIYDAIQFLTHVQIVKTGTKSEAPEPMPRPGVVSRLARNNNPQAQAYLQAIRDRNKHAETGEE